MERDGDDTVCCDMEMPLAQGRELLEGASKTPHRVVLTNSEAAIARRGLNFEKLISGIYVRCGCAQE